ncbi:MAG: QueG-associated DUF1730 domain-containing protein [Flavobacteriales bacterium AspAUS03]
MVFIYFRISKAKFLEEEALRLERWIKKKKYADLHYMENHFNKRLDPTRLVDEARSVISTLVQLLSSEKTTSRYLLDIKYAYGQRTYHHVMKSKLQALRSFIIKHIGKVHIRNFVDSTSILNKSWEG